MREFLKWGAKVVHGVVGGNRHTARLYLNAMGRLCRTLPDGGWKHFILNSMQNARWPELELSPVKVRYPVGNTEAAIVPHLGEFDFTAQLFRRLQYEPEVFHWLETRNYRTIVEIGANVGVFSLYFAKRFPQARVYAFEPSRQAYARLLKNARENTCPNLITFNCAIYSTGGFLKFYEPEGHLTNGSFNPSFAASFSDRVTPTLVPTISAGSMESFFDDGPVLVKIDVEGAEPELLQSLEPLLRQFRPDVLMEVLPLTESSLNSLEFARSGLYRKFSIQPDGLVEQHQFVASEYRDYALLPAG